MAETKYIYNPQTQLWYPLIATGTGDDMTLGIDSNGGVLTPPAYVATTGEPLITTDIYLWSNGLTALDIDEGKWRWFALQASNLVENYCSYSWRVAGVGIEPELAKVVANLTRDLIANSTSKPASNLQSESISNYSYSVRSDTDPNDLFAPYKWLLNSFNQTPVCL